MIYKLDKTPTTSASASAEEAEEGSWGRQGNRPDDPFFASLTPTVFGLNGAVTFNPSLSDVNDPFDAFSKKTVAEKK